MSMSHFCDISLDGAGRASCLHPLLAQYVVCCRKRPSFRSQKGTSSPSAVPEIKFADLKSAVDTGNFDGIKDAGGKFGGFVVTDIPTVGYNDAVENLVR